MNPTGYKKPTAEKNFDIGLSKNGERGVRSAEEAALGPGTKLPPSFVLDSVDITVFRLLVIVVLLLLFLRPPRRWDELQQQARSKGWQESSERAIRFIFAASLSYVEAESAIEEPPEFSFRHDVERQRPRGYRRGRHHRAENDASVAKGGRLSASRARDGCCQC